MGQCYFLEGGRVAGRIMHNTSLCTSGTWERQEHLLLAPSFNPRAAWCGESCLGLAFYTPGTNLCHSQVGGGFTPLCPRLFTHSYTGGSK